MGTGCTFTSLSFYFARGEKSIGRIVSETSVAIWQALVNEYMPIPNRDQWIQTSQRFQDLWNLPNCLGSIDGKHIRIQKLPGSGSENFNYKSFHSLVLMACADADGYFTMIETGYAGRNSDGGIFKVSRIGQWLHRHELDLPTSEPLPFDNLEFPYFFVADEAFPLQKYLMRPYPKRGLNNKRRIFNYRLSRARKTVECAFGMASQKFQVLLSAIRCKRVKTVNSIVRAICILHNYIRKREGVPFEQHFKTNDEETVKARNAPRLQVQQIEINENSNAQTLRDYLSNYFIRPEIALTWQWNYCLPE